MEDQEIAALRPAVVTGAYRAKVGGRWEKRCEGATVDTEELN